MKRSIGAKTIIYPTPVLVVGTYDRQGKPNAMTAAWAGICCSAPPCVGVSLRKATHTYSNIMEKKAFTVNVPSENFVKEADYFGIASGKEIDKFSRTKLTPVKSDLVDAPYIREFPLVLECKLLQSFEIGLHTQFIGEILDVKVEEDMLGENELPDIEKIKPILFTPESRKYFGVGRYLGEAFSIGREI
ncbi:MAG: flavin reductase family protein [Methanotrichaceae archaeon]|nr:flavin reductase family protein [Methanotrichaceae archaeon]